ncbi:hypothetical protein OPV22_016830 [Ensete ventricosum]|uniref:Uncharacterized protein n=1 Tax=Ensete ventricosum TaxID=4639 RepID=A0AAV8PEM9_ENSVE|nr:hypothetical protein OPV22_016830 [Ensete ventricosum]
MNVDDVGRWMYRGLAVAASRSPTDLLRLIEEAVIPLSSSVSQQIVGRRGELFLIRFGGLFCRRAVLIAGEAEQRQLVLKL